MSNHESTIDTTLRAELRQAAEQVSPSELLKERTRQAVCRNEGIQKVSPARIMTHIPKAAVIAMACLVLGGTGVFAAGIITRTIASSPEHYAYTDYSDLEKAEEKAGYSVSIPEAFSNGYSFDGISLVYYADADDDNNLHKSATGINVSYKNAEGNTITLSTQKIGTVSTSNSNLEDLPYQEKENTDEAILFYSRTEYLAVPNDYTPNKEEKDREENDPFFYISYGSDSPETYYNSAVTFDYNGIRYHLSGMSISLSSEEMFGMAQEVLSQDSQ